MKTETQNLIVTILGLYSIISLVGLYLLIAFTSCTFDLALALVPITTTPIGILGGFIAGKTMTEKENEVYLQSLNTAVPEEASEEETHIEPDESEGA